MASKRMKLATTAVSLCLCFLAPCHSLSSVLGASLDPEVEEPHPDPNEEDYDNMIYVGRLAPNSKRRLSFDEKNGITFIFGTSFDETHKDIEEQELHDHHHSVYTDIADRAHGRAIKTRQQVLDERKHKNVSLTGPKPFGHVDEHPLDGGVMPPTIVHTDPFFLDSTLVTNKEFGKFVRATYYETEAEQYGWSFVLSSFLPSKNNKEKEEEVDPEAEHWIAVDGAYWRRPEGPDSSYKFRENHPVVHVSHRDAAEYCAWVGKRLPGEREWEAAARAGNYGPNNRTLYSWGDEPETWAGHANLWGSGTFPYENHAEDGWRGTSPVKTYPPNQLGFYDMTGNVWEWMRGGKHKARIVRGGSYVDTVDGSSNHAATLGARSTIHGTTTTGNVGFRCAKSPKRRTEYHWTYHDEEQVHGTLAIESQDGTQHHVAEQEAGQLVDGDEDEFDEADELFGDGDDESETARKRKKKKVIKPRTRISTEL